MTHLRSRVAELEGVVRELKNKPQPRWAAAALEQQQRVSSSSSTILSSTSPTTPAPMTMTPETPKPALSFPRESWHVRSQRKEGGAGSEDDYGIGLASGREKKRKLDVENDDGNEYRVEMGNGSSSASVFGDGMGRRTKPSLTIGLGSPYRDSTSSSGMIPLSPLSPLAPNGISGRSKGPLSLSNSHHAPASRSSTDPFGGSNRHERRAAITAETLRTASTPISLSRSSKSTKPTTPTTPAPTPCSCLADPTAKHFVAHLSKNIQSTVSFLDTRHHEDLGMPAVDCDVMTALYALTKAVAASSGGKYEPGTRGCGSTTVPTRGTSISGEQAQPQPQQTSSSSSSTHQFDSRPEVSHQQHHQEQQQLQHLYEDSQYDDHMGDTSMHFQLDLDHNNNPQTTNSPLSTLSSGSPAQSNNSISSVSALRTTMGLGNHHHHHHAQSHHQSSNSSSHDSLSWDPTFFLGGSGSHGGSGGGGGGGGGDFASYTSLFTHGGMDGESGLLFQS